MDIYVILSGGLDSTTALYMLKKKHAIKGAITFNYGQRHSREIESAKKICTRLKISHHIIDIKNLNQYLQGSSLTSQSIATPHGHYKKASMKKTIVPNRNAIMINIAAGFAISKKIYGLGLGVHAGDHYIYPDCRPAFIKSQEKTLSLANEIKFRLFTPLLNINKIEIVKKGYNFKVPFQDTWTCYEGGKKPCSKCGSCIERIEAFAKNNLKDPLYNDKEWERLISRNSK